MSDEIVHEMDLFPTLARIAGGKIPEDRVIGLGCVDCRGEHIDTPEEIVARVEKALEYVTPERLFFAMQEARAQGIEID